MNTWFTADTHLNHNKIRKYCNRPFETVEEMDNEIIYRWNKVVKPSDIVYHLGDFCFGNAKDWEKYKSILNGTIILIKGNHDYKHNSLIIKNIFGQLNVKDIMEYKYGKHKSIMLCHYAMRVWNKSHYNAGHLYGHSHGMTPSMGKSFDIGVDCNNFTPVHLDEVIERLDKLPDNPNLIRK